jgi:dUTP pyrophosphatase
MIVKYTKEPHAPEGTLKRANETDAGIDICAAEFATILPLSRKAISTGISVEIPGGYYGRIAPRSGLALKSGIDVMAGVVDSGYRGEIKVILYNTDNDRHFCIAPGDKIAQLIIEKHYNFEFVEASKLTDSERGEKGFGSSG